MDRLVRLAAEGLRRSGWEVAIISEGRNLPWHIRRGYLGLPAIAEDFICYLDRCVRDDGEVKFLTAPDYAGKGLKGVGWNKIEQIELARVSGEKADAVRAFWDSHLMIMMTKNGRFLAICLDEQSERHGKVVTGGVGAEPAVVAASYAELLEQIAELGDVDLYEGLPSGDLAEFVHSAAGREGERRRKSLSGRIKKLFGG